MSATSMRRPAQQAVVHGAAVRQSAPVPQEAPRARRLQAVTPSTAQRKKARPKTVAAVVAVCSVLLMSLGQLALSIALSSGAYELSGLRGEVRELGRTANAISEDLALLGSPQSLAESAAALGMVNVATPAFLRLSDGTVLGSPKAAAGSAKASQAAAALIPNQLLGMFTNPLDLALGQADAQQPVQGEAEGVIGGDDGGQLAGTAADPIVIQAGSSGATGVLAGPTTR